MRQEGHLTSYNLSLKVLTPLHIGSGLRYEKKEYLYENGTVSMLDQSKFLALMASSPQLTDAYTRFMMDDSDRGGLLMFCRAQNIDEQQLNACKIYQVNASNALDPNKPLMGVNAFIRNAHQAAYLPGSSLKGALRTALLMQLLKQKTLPRPLSAEKNQLSLWAKEREIALLHKPGNKQSNPINSLMRGLSVSDSAPLPPHCLTLSAKHDKRPDGSTNTINLLRESLKPGTEVHMTLTLNRHILGNAITIDTIREAISAYGPYYRDTYLRRFSAPGAVPEDADNFLILGGGSGYFAKNLLYPALGYPQALELVGPYMTKTFSTKRGDIHKHHLDKTEYKISPHMLKCTLYQGRELHMGMCQIALT